MIVRMNIYEYTNEYKNKCKNECIWIYEWI